VRISDVQKLRGGGTNKKSKYEFTEQKFRITKTTTFLDICSVACQFFDVDDNQFQLYDENFHDLMSLNKDKGHVAHRVEKYFELIRLKNPPVLYLLMPDRELTSIKL